MQEWWVNMTGIYIEGHQEQDTEKLYAQIGQLKVENDFLKKSCKKLGIEI